MSATALSPTHFKGVEPNEWTFERSWLYPFQFKDIGIRNWLYLWMVALKVRAMWTALVAEQGERLRPIVGTSWTCTRTLTGCGPLQRELTLSCLGRSFAQGAHLHVQWPPTERVYVEWTAKSQQGSLSNPHAHPTEGGSICLSAISRGQWHRRVTVITDYSSFLHLNFLSSLLSLFSALKVLEETWWVGMMELKDKVGR